VIVSIEKQTITTLSARDSHRCHRVAINRDRAEYSESWVRESFLLHRTRKCNDDRSSSGSPDIVRHKKRERVKIYIHIYIYIIYIYIYIYIYVNIYIYEFSLSHVCMYMCIFYVRVYIYTYVYCIYIHVCICVHCLSHVHEYTCFKILGFYNTRHSMRKRFLNL